MNDPRLSRLALGCYPLGGGYGHVARSEAEATIDAALDAGWTFFDTAEAYLESEVVLGETLRSRRDRVFLATKVFPCEPYRLANITVALDNSLRRLQTDVIDLYQLHGPQDWVVSFPDAAAVDEIAAALGALLDSGKVRHVGVCNLPLATLEELQRSIPLFSTQNLYSLYDQGGSDAIHLPVGDVIRPWAAAHDVNFFAFSPLARGLLGARLDPNRTFPPDDERHYLPRFQPEVFPEWARLSNRLESWALDHGRSLPELAVAWTLAANGVTSTLIGAKTASQVEALAGAESWHLGADELAEIDALLATLPPQAAEAKSIVWDHFPPEAVAGMRDRRHALRAGESDPSSQGALS
jgi:aryl-alcohol dehydrogenase-like predicted oxidoreductase